MMFNLSAKWITLLLSAGAASAAGPKLRRRRAAIVHHPDAPVPAAPERQQPRIPSASSDASSAEGEGVPSSRLAVADPSLALDGESYLEGEPITVTFSVGSPSHPYYSSAEAPSLAVDRDYPKYSVGLFMRDADPQGGGLAPIVSINVCGWLGTECEVDDRDYASYGDVSVTFGDEHRALMQGDWPLEVGSYGTGFDAYVLDGRGAAAIGPIGFYVQNEDGEGVDATHAHGSRPARYPPKAAPSSSSMAESSIPSHLASNPLLKYKKGTLKATERQHASVSKGVEAARANAKIVGGSGLEVPIVASAMEEEAVSKEVGAGTSPGAIYSDKGEYEPDEPVSIDFSVRSGGNLSGYRIGIFMRMAHPQGGSLEPVVSLPLCSEGGSGKCVTADDFTTGSVTFSWESMDLMRGASWPIDLYQWGTGFDAYVLDTTGDDVVGPVKFNILMDDM